jgi:Rad3-related DNA helicase
LGSKASRRVIRSETDHGIVFIDRRFDESRYPQLFPRHWRVERILKVDQVQKVFERFWDGQQVSQ